MLLGRNKHYIYNIKTQKGLHTQTEFLSGHSQNTDTQQQVCTQVVARSYDEIDGNQINSNFLIKFRHLIYLG